MRIFLDTEVAPQYVVRMSNEKHNRFGEFCRAQRINKTLTLRQASACLRISFQYLSNVELGRVPPPSRKLLDRMAHVYRTPANEFLKRAENRFAEVLAADDGARRAAMAYFARNGTAFDSRLEYLTKRAIEVAGIQLTPDERERFLQQLNYELVRAFDKRQSFANTSTNGNRLPVRLAKETELEELVGAIAEFLGGLPIGEMTLPIDVERIVESDPRVRLVFRPFWEKEGVSSSRTDEEMETRASSSVSFESGFFEIYLHPESYGGRTPALRREARMSLAHEYLHILAHLSVVPGITRFSNDAERNAWNFASELLMPKSVVQDVWGSNFGGPLVYSTREQRSNWLCREKIRHRGRRFRSLQELFDVNVDPLAIRLANLELLDSQRGDLRSVRTLATTFPDRAPQRRTVGSLTACSRKVTA